MILLKENECQTMKLFYIDLLSYGTHIHVKVYYDSGTTISK